MKIGVDMDEVLCDLNQGVLDYHSVRYGTSHKKEDIESYYLEELFGCTKEEMALILKDFFFAPEHANMVPIVGAIEGIEKLKEHTLYLISARPPHILSVTEEWLEKYFADTFSQIHLVGTDDCLGNVTKGKEELAIELELDLFIEDSLSNAKNISSRGVSVILLDKPWNQSEEVENVYRVKTWGEALEQIEILL